VTEMVAVSVVINKATKVSLGLCVAHLGVLKH